LRYISKKKLKLLFFSLKPCLGCQPETPLQVAGAQCANTRSSMYLTSMLSISSHLITKLQCCCCCCRLLFLDVTPIFTEPHRFHFMAFVHYLLSVPNKPIALVDDFLTLFKPLSHSPPQNSLFSRLRRIAHKGKKNIRIFIYLMLKAANFLHLL